jgi:hypothetical protein
MAPPTAHTRPPKTLALLEQIAALPWVQGYARFPDKRPDLSVSGYPISVSGHHSIG